VNSAFRHKEADADVRSVLDGDEFCRRGAAQVYGQNHHHPSVRADCEKYLLPLLNDSDAEVRRSAEIWLTGLKTVTANGDWKFFEQYLETSAFAEEPDICLHELQELAAVPAKIVTRIADRAVELSKTESTEGFPRPYRFAHYTPMLVVRLYHQTDEEGIKSHCLDLLDAMLALGWNEAAIEVAKAEQ
jgi:hypothetical protein